VADEQVAAEVEEIDAGLLDVPDVAVEHVPVRELAGPAGAQCLVPGERLHPHEQTEERDHDEPEHDDAPARVHGGGQWPRRSTVAGAPPVSARAAPTCAAPPRHP